MMDFQTVTAMDGTEDPTAEEYNALASVMLEVTVALHEADDQELWRDASALRIKLAECRDAREDVGASLERTDEERAASREILT